MTTERTRAINPEAEAAFTRGYPHLRELVDGQPHDDAAADWASKAYLAKKADRESAGASIEGLARLASPLAVKVLEVLGEKKHFAEQVARALAGRGGAGKARSPAKKKPTKK